MTEDYLEEDNIRVILTDYSNWLATTDITEYFDGYININSTLKINTITLKNYLRKVFLVLKEEFPNHCAWEEPEWITRMRGE